MTDNTQIGDELLKQNGLTAGKLSDEDREALRRTLARDAARVKRLKWITAISWATAFVCYLSFIPVGFYMTEVMREGVASTGAVGASWLGGLLMLVGGCSFIVAVVCTVSLLIRSRSLRHRELLASLDEITQLLKQGQAHD